MNGGRQMTGHFSTANVDHHETGSIKLGSIIQLQTFRQLGSNATTSGSCPSFKGLSKSIYKGIFKI